MRMGDFFTSQKTEPPVLTPLGLVLMLLALFIVIYSASRFYKQKRTLFWALFIRSRLE